MAYTLKYDPELNLILASIDGEVTPELLKEYTSEVIHVAYEKNCLRLITDLRNSECKLTTIDLYYIPRMILNLDPPWKARRALVVAESIADYSFYETVSVNTGQDVKIFMDLEEAKNWILKV